MVWLVRVVVVLLLLRLLLQFVAGLVRGLRGESRPARAGATAATGDLVRDRVCNTFLPRAAALRATVAGHEEHFCSPACRDKALAAAR
jgi:hypothetical protein